MTAKRSPPPDERRFDLEKRACYRRPVVATDEQDSRYAPPLDSAFLPVPRGHRPARAGDRHQARRRHTAGGGGGAGAVAGQGGRGGDGIVIITAW